METHPELVLAASQAGFDCDVEDYKNREDPIVNFVRALSQPKAVDVGAIIRRVVEAVKWQEIHHCDNREEMEQELRQMFAALQADKPNGGTP